MHMKIEYTHFHAARSSTRCVVLHRETYNLFTLSVVWHVTVYECILGSPAKHKLHCWLEVCHLLRHCLQVHNLHMFTFTTRLFAVLVQLMLKHVYVHNTSMSTLMLHTPDKFMYYVHTIYIPQALKMQQVEFNCISEKCSIKTTPHYSGHRKLEVQPASLV